MLRNNDTQYCAVNSVQRTPHYYTIILHSGIVESQLGINIVEGSV